LRELNIVFGCRASKIAGLYGGSPVKNVNTKTVIVAGASHARRLVDSLKTMGTSAIYIEAKAWRATTAKVEELTASLRAAVQDKTSDDTSIVLAMYDNSYYMTRCEDGSFTSIRRDDNGSYHVDGDIVCAPLDTAKKMFQQSLTLLREFQEFDKLILVPLPRYLWAACCADLRHAPNIADEDHVQDQLSNLDSTYRLWRSLSFRERLRNTKICNSSNLVADEMMWPGDPVHPSAEAYNRICGYLIKGMEAMDLKKFGDNEEPSCSGKQTGSSLPQQQASKKIATGAYATRVDFPSFRGGPRGNRGGRGWGTGGRRGSGLNNI
jgi:hypothetical protein